MISKGLDKLLQLEEIGGDIAKVKKAIEKGRDCCVFSMPRANRLHLTSHLDKFVLYVAKDTIDANNLYTQLQDYYGESVALLNGNEELLLYRKEIYKSSVGERINTLRRLAERSVNCCVITPQALLQYYPQPERLASAVVTLQKGENVDMYKLIDKLVTLGYSRESELESKSSFSVAGDIISIFPPDSELPIRLSFFDTELESIKLFDIDSRMTVGALESVELLPNNDLLLSAGELESVFAKARKETEKLGVTANTRANEIINELETFGGCCQQMQWLSPFFVDKCATIFDYLSPSSVIVFDETSSVSGQVDMFVHEHNTRLKALALDGEAFRSHAKVILSFRDVTLQMERFVKLGFSNITSTNAIFSPQEIFNIAPPALNNYNIRYTALFDDLKSFVNNGFAVIICQGSEQKGLALQSNLTMEGIYCHYGADVDEKIHGITIVSSELNYGFEYPFAKLAVIGIADITKKSITKDISKKTVFTVPQIGDFVVHEVHGIGKCLGTKRVKTGTIERDYVVVQYAKGDLLYVPIDGLNRLNRYSGNEGEPKLSIIGGKDFEKIKESVKKSVKEMAINLVELYSKREKKNGYKYPVDTIWQKEFENSFEFTETPDQLTAISEIKADMERGKIMDRLLCGDVGYGKTEVALRAIFKTIMENRQAVILAPTTILAKQHYNTAMARFNEFKIKVEPLTRFQTPQQIEKSLNNLATGKSLVAVATHRILSADVQFKDLGLLVLDEEQRFGVEHKEKLKVIKNNVNVLTLSATPIPRTLSMAMTGIRDISILETPPKNRIPVQTTVAELTNGLLQDAINRELARGGQVFVLFNSVAKIDAFAQKVQELVPAAKIIVGHGQMDSVQLEERINQFYNQEGNVLICTTIIENGIDIPNANTLIICDADKLGLAQMYQLRGRVGRSNRIAYAYFTVSPNRVLTENASKRLSAIMDYTDLGSGFKIAMRDLEIRGAGNILGKEQHGHIEKVGYDLYCKLLKQVVDEAQGIENNDDNDIIVSVNVDSYLDDSYIESENARLKVYKEIAELRTLKERDELETGLAESYGELPSPLLNLIDIGLIKNLAREIGVTRLTIADKSASLIFGDSSCFRKENIFLAVESFKDKCTWTNDNQPKLIFDCKFLLNVEKMRLLRQFLLKSQKIID
ncbi:MAG: transcription-repair coupling factor [Clostridia bacterium]